ncbi:DUF1343 domain-containing protein [candidate division KSB1 bacterium]|nr:DUF1343 domain-containing protein [candidate division KSB1 bacterium]
MQGKLSVVILFFMISTSSLIFGQNFNHELKSQSRPKIKLGIDVLLEKHIDVLKGKNVGLITNHTGVNCQLKPTIDVLNDEPDINLVAIFGPEHGARGDVAAGEHVSTYTDKRTGIKVYSLYGKTRKPTTKMLGNIDVLIYDIQDIGSRAYTYIYTMAYAMEAAKEAGIKFIVLDRPNPMGGNKIGGNVLDPKFSSFIGLYPIPYIYGMTVGELALLFNKEYKINCDLTVIPMEGWERNMLWKDTGLEWIPTSPHLPHSETAFFVATTGCIGELGTVSIGVGYTSPFELIGTPWIDGEKLALELNAKELDGVYFRPTSFKPYYAKFINELCSGIQIHILDFDKYEPATTQVHILTAIKKQYPKKNIFDKKRISMFDKAFGTDEVRKRVIRGDSAESILRDWGKQLEKFDRIRGRYLIY